MSHLPTLRYSIAPLSPEAHLFEVRCTVADPDPQGQQFALPVGGRPGERMAVVRMP